MSSSPSSPLNSLIIRGPYKGTSGYDHHVREFTNALTNKGINVALQNFTSWGTEKQNLPSSMDNICNNKRSVDANTVLHFVMPPQVDMAKGKRNVNFTMFEADRIPNDWLAHNLKHDRVIVPTESSKQAWVQSGYPQERIQLCPLGVNPGLFTDNVQPLSLQDNNGRSIADYKTRVLNISDLIPRKNLIGMLRVWIKNTSANDNAILIIKTSTPWRRWLYKFLFDVKRMERQIGKTRKQAAPILLLLNQKYSDEKMCQLYASATHYWSMSFGEGWDLCMMEAGATGLNLIAPNHTAYPEYLNRDIASIIPVQQVPAKFFWAHGLHKLFKGANWWQPDEGIAGGYIQEIIKSDNSKKDGKAKKHIINNFSWDKATTRLVDILTDLD